MTVIYLWRQVFAKVRFLILPETLTVQIRYFTWTDFISEIVGARVWLYGIIVQMIYERKSLPNLHILV